ncbi:hypothetical protein [Chakrabartyella piscis]|uniref:hypothetical protein n=1 Tax=Chakrabartyella piscis TaxID=2918914 RepID=UPI002958C29A|nr:hypothetical protein [Chakrabartyella piscis]
MGKRAFLSANEAAAYGVKLAKPDVVSAYPITHKPLWWKRLRISWQKAKQIMNI